MTKKDTAPEGVPGFMMYLCFRDLFETLRPAQVKHLLLAMMDYVAEGTVPAFEDSGERIAWATLSDKLNRDMRHYEKKCLQNRYNRFLREAQRYWDREDCPDFETWLELSEKGICTIERTLQKVYDRWQSLQNLPNKNADATADKNTNAASAKNSIASLSIHQGETSAKPQRQRDADPSWGTLRPLY